MGRLSIRRSGILHLAAGRSTAGATPLRSLLVQHAHDGNDVEMSEEVLPDTLAEHGSDALCEDGIGTC